MPTYRLPCLSNSQQFICSFPLGNCMEQIICPLFMRNSRPSDVTAATCPSSSAVIWSAKLTSQREETFLRPLLSVRICILDVVPI